MQRYISDELTHLTGRRKSEEDAYGALLSILKSGVLRHSGEAIPQGTFPDNPLLGGIKTSPDADLIGHEMFKADVVCFCDIPVADLALHAKKYSRFGLSFRKTYLLHKGATPVFYVAADSTRGGNPPEPRLSEHFEAEVRRLHQFIRLVQDTHSPPPGEEHGSFSEEEANQDLFLLSSLVMTFLSHRVFCFVKFFEAELPSDDERNYYMEREWRVLGAVNFQLDDVHRILVPAEYGPRLSADLPGYSGQVSFLPD